MKFVTTEFKSGGLHEKHVVSRWPNGPKHVVMNNNSEYDKSLVVTEGLFLYSVTVLTELPQLLIRDSIWLLSHYCKFCKVWAQWIRPIRPPAQLPLATHTAYQSYLSAVLPHCCREGCLNPCLWLSHNNQTLDTRAAMMLCDPDRKWRNRRIAAWKSMRMG